jgi:hypothetical protein
MKKLAFALVLVLMATPVWADVFITCEPGPGTCDVTVKYNADSEASNVRGFGLDFDTGDANVVDVNCVNSDFYVYPGSIGIDASGTVTDWGECVCSGYAGTQSGTGDPNVTIEMISNYVGETNEPDSNGTLAIITLSCNATVDVNVNVLLGGVVMEDPNENPTVHVSGCVVAGCEDCGVGPVENCQMASECAGHSSGDSTCNGSIDLADLFALKAHFGKSAPWQDPECCSDYDNSQQVNLGDLFIKQALAPVATCRLQAIRVVQAYRSRSFVPQRRRIF